MATFDSNAGLAYTAASATWVTDFEEAITSYLASQEDTMSRLEAMLATDPQMVMAWCFRGYLLELAAHPQFNDEIGKCISRAKALCDQGLCTDREQAHVQALDLWCADHAHAALKILESILVDFPLDMLALRMAHYVHFYNGKAELMRDSTARVLGAWHSDHPHYSYLQGMHAFGLEESTQYDEAEALGREAVSTTAIDIWATHAVAHVYQMRSEHEQGVEWLNGLRDQWQGTNNFRYHVIWHEALHWLGLGATDKALRIYDDTLAGSLADDFYLDLGNNASLLWRLEFAGVDVGERWLALVDVAAGHVEDQELVFASLRYLIPLAVTHATQAPSLIRTRNNWSQTNTDQGEVCARVGVGLADAIAASVENPQAAAEMLKQHQPATYLVGGSNAQRDLFLLLATDRTQHA